LFRAGSQETDSEFSGVDKQVKRLKPAFVLLAAKKVYANVLYMLSFILFKGYTLHILWNLI
jgi:hypothetical protein